MKKILLILFFGICLLPSISNAVPLLFTIDTEFDTLQNVNFGTITVNEENGDLVLTVSLNTIQLGTNADLHEFFYNLREGFTNIVVSGANVVSSAFDYTPNANNPFKADGDGYYDGYVNFGEGANPTIQITTFMISADQSLIPTDLNYMSVDGAKGPYYMAIHAQNTSWIGGEGASSEYAGASNPGVPIPEPATMLLLGSGLLGLAGVARRRFKK